MGKWEMVRLGDVLSDTITGEWGDIKHSVPLYQLNGFETKKALRDV